MSEQVPTQVPTITSQVPTGKPPKNPGRVASGKRLAEISKAARERKKEELNSPAYPYWGASDSLFTYQNIFALVGISIGAAALYYELSRKTETSAPAAAMEAKQHTVEIPLRGTPGELESFD